MVNTQVIMNNNTVEFNFSPYASGIIFCKQISQTSSVTKSTFSSNIAQEGGAIYLISS